MLLRLFLLSCLFSTLSSGKEKSSISLISYNIRNDNPNDKGPRNWADRKDLLTTYLRDHKASIIGLQEVKHHQLEDLIQGLPDHQSIGVGRDDGKTAGEYSPIFFDRRVWKLDPKEHGTYWLSDTPEVIASRTWGNSHNRICTWARLIKIAPPGEGTALYIYNTHWDHRSQPARVKSGELMLQRMKVRTHQKDPYIFMGDFNATIENPAIVQFLKPNLLIDHAKEKKKSSSHWKAELVPGLRIDHIFTSPFFKEALVAVDSNGDEEGNAASDHHPVRLELPLASFANN